VLEVQLDDGFTVTGSSADDDAGEGTGGEDDSGSDD
jgi:hypothetical protein